MRATSAYLHGVDDIMTRKEDDERLLQSAHETMKCRMVMEVKAQSCKGVGRAQPGCWDNGPRTEKATEERMAKHVEHINLSVVIICYRPKAKSRS